uniref:Uncharacterized protein n=1 Tax=Timema genevievae TaxID=629358 RepID=A0A7R9JSS1_TIMGE|nr:unnamed protein product [Timema genevievae]
MSRVYLNCAHIAKPKHRSPFPTLLRLPAIGTKHPRRINQMVGNGDRPNQQQINGIGLIDETVDWPSDDMQQHTECVKDNLQQHTECVKDDLQQHTECEGRPTTTYRDLPTQAMQMRLFYPVPKHFVPKDMEFGGYHDPVGGDSGPSHSSMSGQTGSSHASYTGSFNLDLSFIYDDLQQHTECVKYDLPQHIECVKYDLQQHTECVKYDLQQHTECVKDELQQHTECVKDKLQQHTECVKDELQQHTECVKDELQQHTECVKDELQQHTECVKGRPAATYRVGILLTSLVVSTFNSSAGFDLSSTPRHLPDNKQLLDFSLLVATIK